MSGLRGTKGRTEWRGGQGSACALTAVVAAVVAAAVAAAVPAMVDELQRRVRLRQSVSAGRAAPDAGRPSHGYDAALRTTAASDRKHRVIGMLVLGVLVMVATVARASSSTMTPTFKSAACPVACVCESEQLPEIVESRRRLGKMMWCTGTPLSEVGSMTTEVLRVRNVTVRRLDFFPLRRMPALLVLDLSGAGIIELGGSGKDVPNLRSLDLSGNTIHVLQTYALRDFPELRMLNLSNNGLHSVDLSALRLRMLHVLDLRHNKLTSLKLHPADLPMLQDLLLSENALSVVPGFVFPSNLRVLDLSRNKLVRFEEGAFDGVNISVVLDLGHNSLRRVPNSALKRLSGVGLLILDGNPLQTLVTGSVTGVLAQKISIEHVPALDLVHRDAFVNLPELQSLSLAYNPGLSYIHPESFRNVPRLQSLDLSSTALFTLEHKLLSSAPFLQRVSMDGNTLHCDCGLGWLHNLTDSSFPCRDNTTKAPQPDTKCAPFIIPLFPSDYWETLGNNATFQCRAVGYPDVNVTWFSKDRQILSNNGCVGRVCVGDNTLTILYLHAGDAGRYTCVASNEMGSDSRTVSLHVRDVHVRLFPLTVTSTFVTLAWNMSSAVTNNYMLRVEEEECPEASKSVVFSVGLKMHSYTVHGLKPGARYTFTLAIKRQEYTLVIGSTAVTMREGDFLVTLGIERSYLSIILLSALAGIFLAACLSFCGLRCWKQRLRLQQAAAMRKSDSAFSGRDMLSTSCSAESDLGVGLATPHITYISLSEERRPLSGLSAVSPTPLPSGTPLERPLEACCVWDESLMGVT